MENELLTNFSYFSRIDDGDSLSSGFLSSSHNDVLLIYEYLLTYSAMLIKRSFDDPNTRWR